MDAELQQREARLVSARRALAELSAGAAVREMLADIDQVHALVEKAERMVVRSWAPGLRRLARRRLTRAEAAEKTLLAAHGFESWLGLQMRRIELLFEPATPDVVVAAEQEYRLALVSWQELAGADAPEPADPAGSRALLPGVASTIGLWPTASSA